MNYLPIPSTHPPGATEIEEETSDAPARGFPADAPAVLDRLKRSTRILLLACVVLAAVSIGAYLEYSNIYTEVFNTCYARYQREVMPIPGQMPEPLRNLLQRMVALSFSEWPSLREAYTELINMHAVLRTEGHISRFLRTVWGVPQQMPPHRSSIRDSFHNLGRSLPTALPVKPSTPGRSVSSDSYQNLTTTEPLPPPAQPSSISENPISDTHQLFDQLAHQEGSSTISLGQLSLYLPCQHPESAAKWLAETVWSTLKSFPHVSFAALLCDLMTPAPDTCVSALAASRGQTVRNGELNLGVLPSGTMGKWKPGLIVFESACEALNFTGTTFKGGIVVCSGEGCRVTFTDVKFQNCSVVALEGAQVFLTNCSFTVTDPVDVIVALQAIGNDTHVDMRDSTVDGNGSAQGVAVRHGAQLQAKGVALSNISKIGFEGRGTGTQLTLSECTIHDLPAPKIHLTTSTATWAIALLDKCAAVLTRVKCSAAGGGIRISDSAKASLTSCDIENSHCQVGIRVTSGADAQIQGCSVRDSKCTGIVVDGSGTHVAMSESTSSYNEFSGMCVQRHAQAEVRKCNFHSNRQHGLNIRTEAVLKATQCVSERNQWSGFIVDTHGRMELSDSKACENQINGCVGVDERTVVKAQQVEVQGGMAGYDILRGAQAVLMNCSCLRSCEWGIRTENEGTLATVTDCIVKDCVNGVAVHSGAVAVIQRVTSTGHHSVGFASYGEGSRMELHSCRSAPPVCFETCNGGVMEKEDCWLIDHDDVKNSA